MYAKFLDGLYDYEEEVFDADAVGIFNTILEQLLKRDDFGEETMFFDILITRPIGIFDRWYTGIVFKYLHWYMKNILKVQYFLRFIIILSENQLICLVLLLRPMLSGFLII